MTRNFKFLLTAGAAIGGTLTLSARNDRPNVVIIVADDLGYADVGFHNCNSEIQTPNIDQLASEGVHCTTAYVTNAVSSPSRAGFLSGRYQQRFGYEDNPGPFRLREGIHPGIPEGVKLMPDYLKDAGYKSALIGKWHLGGEESDESFPTRKGFDRFFGFLEGATIYFHEENEEGKIFDQEKLAKLNGGYFTDLIGDESIKFIKKNKKNPFLLYMAFNAVHSPLQAPEETINLYSHIKDPQRRKLCAMQQEMDKNVGRVLDYLKKEGLEDNTIVFFFSDNGGAPTDNHSCNYPFKGSKGTFYDGGIHTPFIVKWPGHVKEGQVYDKMVSSLDILPTVMHAAGLETPEVLDGVDLMPYFDGKNTNHPHDILYWKMNAKFAVRDLEWKLVFNTPDEGLMLFNIANDPYEKNDLAAAMPEKVKEMQAKFDAWKAQNPKSLFGWQPSVGKFIQHTDQNFEHIDQEHFKSIGNVNLSVIKNPKKNNLNPSNKVFCIENNGASKLSGFAGNVARFNKHLRYLHIKVWMSEAGKVSCSLKGDKGFKIEHMPMNPCRQAGKWQDLVFDFGDFNRAVVSMGFFSPVLAKDGGYIYIDDIHYTDSAEPEI